ncbi:MAG: lipopolysaccharide biosynthesis protein [Gammaproteobacteria bacterium]
MARGAAWMVLLRIVDRAIGLVSTVVLARLLVPGDFGLIAIAAALLGMLEVLGAVGLDVALIQRPDARREHFDTAWTFHVLFGLATALVVSVAATPVASFYDDPRLMPVMLMLAATQAVQAFENIGVVAFRKELEFDREFRYRISRRVVTTFLVTIPLAFALQNYWALLIGSLVGSFLSVALSYALHPYRPRLSLVAFGELMSFSKWFLLTSIVEYLYGRMAGLVIGKWSGPAAVGAFSIAGEVATLATREISAPVQRAVFPGYAKLAGDRVELRRVFLKVTSLLLLVVLPSGLGISLLAEPVVNVALGSKWTSAIPLIKILGINGILTVFLSSAHYVNLAVGMARSTSLVLAAHSAITIPLLFLTVPKYGAQGAVMSMLIASVITAPFNYYLVGKAIEFGWHELKTMLWRPLVAALVMSGAVLALQSLWLLPVGTPAQLAYVLVNATLGAAVYGATVYLLWRGRSDPASAEAWVLERAAGLAAGVAGVARARFGIT